MTFGGDSAFDYSLFVVTGASILCGVLCCVLVSWCLFKLCNHLAVEGKVACFTLIVLWLSLFCVFSSRCHPIVCGL